MNSKAVVIFLARRSIELVLLFLLIVTLTFLMLRIVPSDPSVIVINSRMSPEMQAELRDLWGLDNSLLTQYVTYVKNVLSGNLGVSFYYGEELFPLIIRRLLPTLVLTAPAAAAALLIDFLLEKKKKTALTGIIFYVVPFLWIGLLLIVLFSYYLHLFPQAGWKSIEVWEGPAPLTTRILDVVHHLVLPCLVMIIWCFMGCILVKANIQGIFQKKPLFHPVVMTLLSAAVLLFGLKVTETTFSWPGFNRAMLEAGVTYDYPLFLGAFIAAWAFSLVLVLCIETYYTLLMRSQDL